MINVPLPSWWIDIQQSQQNALSELESVMNVIEKALADSGNQSTRTLQTNLARWSELVGASMSAAESLKRSVRLAQSRRSDAQAMGLQLPSDAGITNRVARASLRLGSLVSETRIQMNQIKDELKQRQPRRQQSRLYRDNSPSHIDVHV